MSDFFFKIKKYLTHLQASMLSLVDEKPVSLEVHTALGSPWEGAEYLNIIYHVGRCKRRS